MLLQAEALCCRMSTWEGEGTRACCKNKDTRALWPPTPEHINTKPKGKQGGCLEASEEAQSLLGNSAADSQSGTMLASSTCFAAGGFTVPALGARQDLRSSGALQKSLRFSCRMPLPAALLTASVLCGGFPDRRAHGLLRPDTLQAFVAPGAGGARAALSPPLHYGRGKQDKVTVMAYGGGRGGEERGRRRQPGGIFRRPGQNEPETLSMQEFMAMSSRLDDDERAGPPLAIGDRARRFIDASTNPGDWTCPECGVLVFASKSSCFRCRARKPMEPRQERGERVSPDMQGGRVDMSRDFERDTREARKRDLLATGRGVLGGRGNSRGGRGRGGRGREKRRVVDDTTPRGSAEALWKSRINVSPNPRILSLPCCLTGFLHPTPSL